MNSNTDQLALLLKWQQPATMARTDSPMRNASVSSARSSPSTQPGVVVLKDKKVSVVVVTFLIGTLIRYGMHEYLIITVKLRAPFV